MKSKLIYICVLLILSIALIIKFYKINYYNNTKNKFDVQAQIIGLKVDHVVRFREGCRHGKILLLINIINRDTVKRKLSFSRITDHCNRNIDTSNTYWLVWKKRIPLVADHWSDTVVELLPGEEKRVYLRAMYNFFGLSLRDIEMIYSPWFQDTFKILYRNEGKEYIFKKSKNFRISLYLDDTLVNPNDSIRYNMSIPGPPIFESDTTIQNMYIKDEIYLKWRDIIWDMDW